MTVDFGAEINKELSLGTRLFSLGSCLYYPLGPES